MLLDGLGNRRASFQLWGQGETLPLLFVVSALILRHLGQIGCAPSNDAAEKAGVRQPAQCMVAAVRSIPYAC